MMWRQLCFVWCILTVLLAWGSVATWGRTPATSQPASTQPQTGRFSLESAPIDVRLFNEVRHRLQKDAGGADFMRTEKLPSEGRDGKHPENATDKHKELVYVPETYAPDKSWGLLVYMSPMDATEIPNWENIAKKRHLLIICPQDVGNEHWHCYRTARAIRSVQLMNATYKINPDRVYLYGLSGGAATSSEAAMCFPEIFTGASMNCGVYCVSINGTTPNNAVMFVVPESIRAARERVRFYIFAGTKDELHDMDKLTAAWMKKNGFKYVTFADEEGAGHGTMSEENFVKGLVALDAPLVAEAPVRAKKAEIFLKNQPGQALLLYQQAAFASPGSEESDQVLPKYEELLATYQAELGKTQSVVDGGDRAKANAAITSLDARYTPWCKDDVAALRKQLSQARPAK